ncbi:hypothetical protein [Novosphingobium sp.]|jgi:hypothetical protein
MERVIWRDNAPEQFYNTHDSSGLDAARGLIIGMAISQVFWMGLALFLL